MAALLKVDGKEWPAVPALGQFSIAELQELINSPFIEVIPIRPIYENKFMVVDEAGFESKPFNAKASREASRALYGDALIATFEELGGLKEMEQRIKD